MPLLTGLSCFRKGFKHFKGRHGLPVKKSGMAQHCCATAVCGSHSSSMPINNILGWCAVTNDLLNKCWCLMKSRVSNMNRRAEYTYHSSETMANLVNQVMFFMLCDRWFCPGERLTGLYCLLFYNVICYLVAYGKQLISLQDYSPIVRVSEHTNIRHLAMTATKVVLDLTKAITMVISGVFMLLVFGLEQGLDHFNPTWCYIVVTAFYFVITERSCQQKAPSLLSWLQMDLFENLESLWVPVLLRFVASLTSGLMITLVWMCTDGGWMLLLSATYVNVFLGLRDMDRHWKTLMTEKSSLDKYRFATKQDLSERDDVCPVCLQTMLCARITPCRHFFHGDCLRRCLKERMTCPLCKQEL